VGGVTAAVLTELGDAMAEICGWDSQQRATEIEAAVDNLRDAHRVEVTASTATV